MTNTEIAYLAGIIDGEGSIMLTKYHKSEYPSPCISISSTDLELLEWIKEKVGSGRITRKKLRANFIINNYKNVTARNGKYSEEKLKLKEQFYIDFMALKKL